MLTIVASNLFLLYLELMCVIAARKLVIVSHKTASKLCVVI